MNDEQYDLPLVKEQLEKLFEALVAAQVIVEDVVENLYDGKTGKRLSMSERESRRQMMQSTIESLQSFSEIIAMKDSLLPLLDSEMAFILKLREAAANFENLKLGLPKGSTAGSYTYEKLMEFLVARAESATQGWMKKIESNRRKSANEFANEILGSENGGDESSN